MRVNQPNQNYGKKKKNDKYLYIKYTQNSLWLNLFAVLDNVL